VAVAEAATVAGGRRSKVAKFSKVTATVFISVTKVDIL
jgi:hypothetical protein